MYRITREAYGGLLPKGNEHLPDVIAVRISNMQIRPGGQFRVVKRVTWPGVQSPPFDLLR